MENNSDRMGFALIALSVVAFVLLAVNGTLQPTVKGFLMALTIGRRKRLMV